MSYSMQKIADRLSRVVHGKRGSFSVATSDSIMSSIVLNASLDFRGEWTNGIIQNSRYFQFMIVPQKGGQFYSGEDRITVFLNSANARFATFRKYTGTIGKVLDRVSVWIDEQRIATDV